MTRIIAFLATLFLSVGAHAQPAVSGAGFSVTPPPGVSAAAAASVYVTAFGAACNDVADDTAAINAAIAQIATNQTGGPSGMYGSLVFPASKSCRVTGTLNFGSLTGLATVVQGQGATIDCQQTAVACINALGMKHTTVRDLNVYGNPSFTPTTGIQMGRLTNVGVADTNAFDNIHLFGNYSLAAFYNFAGEVMNIYHSIITNNAAANCYALIEDIQNHFGVVSGASVDTAQSLNEQSITGSTWIEADNGCTPLWIAGGNRMTFDDAYILSGTTGPPIVLWDANLPTQLTLDIHTETAPTDTIFFDGPVGTTSFSLIGLRYRDHANQATNSVFKLNPNITNAKLLGGSIDIGLFTGTPKLFDTGTVARWSSINSDIYLPASSTAMNASSVFSGILKKGSATSLYQDVQTFTIANGLTTWTVPGFCSNTGITCVSRLRVIGSGGSGGGGAQETLGTTGAGGGSGGGGCALDITTLTSQFTSPVTVTVGAAVTGGNGGAVGNGSDGAQGNNTTFGTYVAYGGGRGGGGTTTTSGGGGAGGTNSLGGNATGATAGTASPWLGTVGGGGGAAGIPLPYGCNNAPGSGASNAGGFYGTSAGIVGGSSAGGSITSTSTATNGSLGAAEPGVAAASAGTAAGSGTAGAGGNATGSGGLFPNTSGAGGGGANNGGTGGAGGGCASGASQGYGAGGGGGGGGTTAGGAGGNSCPGYVAVITNGS